jgi:hypothetical protein
LRCHQRRVGRHEDVLRAVTVSLVDHRAAATSTWSFPSFYVWSRACGLRWSLSGHFSLLCGKRESSAFLLPPPLKRLVMYASPDPIACKVLIVGTFAEWGSRRTHSTWL